MKKENKGLNKEAKSKILTAVVVVFLCAIFFVGFGIGLSMVLAMEGAYPPNDITESAYIAPASEEEVIAFLGNSLDHALKENPKIEYEREYDFAHDGGAYTDYNVESEGSDEFIKTVKYIMKDVDNSDSELYSLLMNGVSSASTEYGESIKDILRIPSIKAEDIESFEVNYIYYKCSSCGENSDDPLDKCELCGSEMPYQMKYKNDYTVKLEFKTDNDEFVNANFAPVSKADIINAFSEKLDGAVKIDNVDYSYSKLAMTYRVNRMTNEINLLRFIKYIDVTADISLCGIYGSLGSQKISFVLEQEDSYYLTWPSLELSDHKMSVAPKKTDNLQATLTCSAPTEMEVKWVSSDESVITVDDEGYLKAGKNAGSATITASFEFNGKTYSDSCEVDVKVSVESMKMAKRKVKLNVNDTFRLETKISPNNATVKSVKWTSENEEIATVDENGVVTAVAPGTVVVFALSDDGYFKSSCEVIVK